MLAPLMQAPTAPLPPAFSIPAPLPVATPSPLYTRQAGRDPERSAGSQVHYDSFADVKAAFEAEAADPRTFGLADFLDIFNPLQHIPLVNHLYREVSGDTLKPGAASMVGGTLFGGGLGLASASVNNTLIQDGGQSMDHLVLAALRGEAPATADIQMAAADLNALSPAGHPVESRKPRSFYRDVAPYEHADRVYSRVAMADSERSAGSFVRYG